MQFNSWAFLTLLSLTFVLYHTVLKRTGYGRQALLLFASYVFYGWWDWRFLSLIILSTTIDFIAGTRIHRAREIDGAMGRARAWMLVSVLSNLTILGIFKYFNFFMENLEPILRSFGMQNSWFDLNIILPVGISFYTFQSMAYTIDVYRGVVGPCRNYLTFATYVAFFPQLVAGPIERAGHLIPQLRTPRPLDAKLIQSGLALLILGFFKKLVIADPISPYVMETVADPGAYTTSRLLMAGYLFSFQIYADFSGYSDIARGSARLFGIDLMRNFEQPYLSKSIREGWHRWHISLSRWFFDYVYIPLGGNRVSTRRLYFNIIAVMTISGFWHGANWTFIIWGLFHGTLMSIERYRASERKEKGIPPPAPSRLRDFLATFRIFHVWMFGFLIFVSKDLSSMLVHFHGIVTRWQFWFPGDTSTLLWLLAVAAVMFFIDIMQRRTGVHEFPLEMRPFWGGLILALMVLGIIYWSDQPGVAFIYFQF